jgi:flavodoxin
MCIGSKCKGAISMRVLVTCFSLTGNTELIAKGIFDELSDKVAEVELEQISKIDPKSLADFDLVFIGSACHDADLAKPVKDFLKGIPSSLDLKLAGFVTHSTYLSNGSKRRKELYKRWAGKCEGSLMKLCKKRGIDYLGYFHCQGKPSPEIADFIHRVIVTEEEEWQEYIEEVNRHPDEEDILNVKAFVQDILAML